MIRMILTLFVAAVSRLEEFLVLLADRVIDELNPENQFLKRKLDNLLEYEVS